VAHTSFHPLWLVTDALVRSPPPLAGDQDESVIFYVSITDVEGPSGRHPPRRPYALQACRGPVWGRAPVRVGSSDRDEQEIRAAQKVLQRKVLTSPKGNCTTIFMVIEILPLLSRRVI